MAVFQKSLGIKVIVLLVILIIIFSALAIVFGNKAQELSAGIGKKYGNPVYPIESEDLKAKSFEDLSSSCSVISASLFLVLIMLLLVKKVLPKIHNRDMSSNSS